MPSFPSSPSPSEGETVVCCRWQIAKNHVSTNNSPGGGRGGGKEANVERPPRMMARADHSLVVYCARHCGFVWDLAHRSGSSYGKIDMSVQSHHEVERERPRRFPFYRIVSSSFLFPFPKGPFGGVRPAEEEGGGGEARILKMIFHICQILFPSAAVSFLSLSLSGTVLLLLSPF